MIIVASVLMLGFEMEVGRVVEYLFRLSDCIVGCILIGA